MLKTFAPGPSTRSNKYHNFKCGEVYCNNLRAYNITCGLCGRQVDFLDFPLHYSNEHLNQLRHCIVDVDKNNIDDPPADLPIKEDSPDSIIKSDLDDIFADRRQTRRSKQSVVDTRSNVDKNKIDTKISINDITDDDDDDDDFDYDDPIKVDKELPLDDIFKVEKELKKEKEDEEMPGVEDEKPVDMDELELEHLEKLNADKPAPSLTPLSTPAAISASTPVKGSDNNDGDLSKTIKKETIDDINDYDDDDDDDDWDADFSDDSSDYDKKKSKSKRTKDSKDDDNEDDDDNSPRLKCTECSNMYKNRRSLTQHMRRVHLKKMQKQEKAEFKCDQCDAVFAHERNLTAHKYKHTGIFCDVCGKTFSQVGNMMRHKIRHTGVKEHQCQECPDAFYTQKELRCHMMVHTGILPFICEICGRRCRDHGVLSAHMRRHTGERPAKCQVCGKSFYSYHDLNVHAVAHTSERPFACDICGSTFQRKKALRVHKKIHSKDRNYVCKVCGKAFAVNSGLNAHMRSHDTARNRSTDPVSIASLSAITGGSDHVIAVGIASVDSVGDVVSNSSLTGVGVMNEF